MTTFFVPFHDNSPAKISIKGHNLLLVTTESDQGPWEIEKLTGGQCRAVEVDGNDSQILSSLASEIEGGVVLAPPGVPLDAVLANLEQTLPWLH